MTRPIRPRKDALPDHRRPPAMIRAAVVDPPYQPCCTDATGMPVPCQHPPVDPLREWLAHRPECRKVGGGIMGPQPCSCGLDAALASPAAPPEGRTTAEKVWDALESDPEFVAGMERARADVEAGRVTPYRHIAPRPEGLDVERLAEAMRLVHEPAGTITDWPAVAARYAAEYARLSATSD